jgi:DNA-binding PadR family transcriptional regulator
MNDDLEYIAGQLMEPRWTILRALRRAHPMAGIDIVRKINEQRAYYQPDPSMLHFYLRQLEEFALVACLGEREVEVPGPLGTTRRALRAVFVLTDRGAEVLRLREM